MVGVILIGYSNVCFCRPGWVSWISVSPVLERKNPFTPFMLVAHGLISGIAGVVMVVTAIYHIIFDH
jgi:hypothetical protein